MTDEDKKALDETQRRIKRLESARSHKSVSAALALSIVLGIVGIMGIGHFYGGRYRRGFIILVSGLLMMFFVVGGLLIPMISDSVPYSDNDFNIMIFTIPLIALYIWQIIDARKTVKLHNKLVR